MPAFFIATDLVSLLYENASKSSGILSWCAHYGIPVIALAEMDGIAVIEQPSWRRGNIIH